VAIGKDDGVPVMRAAFRDGIGCVVLAPDQTFDDLDSLPQLTTPPPPGDPARTPWPAGDRERNVRASRSGAGRGGRVQPLPEMV
jgi:hypothetical protein